MSLGQGGVSQVVPDLKVAYWLLGQKGRRFDTLERAWELRYLANQEHVDILGFNKSGKLVVKAPGREVMDDAES